MVKPLPFQLQRELAVPLSAQIADGVQRAIGDGYYQAGDRLPNLDDMAARLQVARQTVRVAVGSLVNRGAVVARRKRGIEVLDPGSRAFTHHVLHLSRGGTAYYFGTRNARLAALLTEARLRYTCVDVSPEELAAGLPHVRAILEGSAVELVLIDGPTGMVSDLCRQHQVPYICVNQEVDPEAVAQVMTDHAACYRALARYAAQRGVRRALLAGIMALPPELPAAFTAAGMAIEALLATPRQPGSSEAIEHAGYAAIEARLASPTPLPDLIYFVDDYLARGGLMALVAGGVRVPQQLRVASHVNRGYCPAFPVSLTRLETDPMAGGALVAQVILDLLRTGQRPSAPAVLIPQLIPGESL